ncbi:MAG: hypothetical protein HY892_00255 [Deltaproteobacteria bacterium]|nr:hypothetical protein [Deltaproteobacteria bacterium]
MLRGIFKRREKRPSPELLEQLRRKYETFQQLLADNQAVLEIVTDLEEKYNGDYLFDMQYLRVSVKALADRVFSLINGLNSLADDRYGSLYPVYDRINGELLELLAKKRKIPPDPPVLPLQDITLEKEESVGGKAANLGELYSRLHLPVPEGFAVTARGYQEFIETNRLQEEISRRLAALDLNKLEDLVLVSREIQALILSKDLPAPLAEAIARGYGDLTRKLGGPVTVSVRSSALGEDSRISFAGQYGTALNVPGEEIGEKYKAIIASKFTPRALFYFIGKGFREEDIAMGVACLAMVRARAGGVLYTVDPLAPHHNELIIHAHWGLGKAVVDGTVTPDVFVVTKEKIPRIKSQQIAHKETLLDFNPQGGVESRSVPPEEQDLPSLSPENILTLTALALEVEGHYQRPQDLEWAIDHQDRVVLLQTRPLKVFAPKICPEDPTASGPVGNPVLLGTGIMGAHGVGSGPVFRVDRDEDLPDFPAGGILVAHAPSPRFVTVMNRARGIVTDLGSAASHMAAVAREFRVATILNAQRATEVLTPGQVVTVDANNRIVYEGVVNSLLLQEEFQHNPFEYTSLFILFEKILARIVPLNLIDPYDPEFSAKNCQTFHDLTRFVHQTATQEMFNLSASSAKTEKQAQVLESNFPVEIFLVDLGGGIREEARGRRIKPEQIHSWPMQALWKGIETMKWPGPKPMDVKGFASVVAQTATTGGGDSEQVYSEKSFALLSRNYLNFSIRLGYHLSTIEVYGAEGVENNYIKFNFKGGGATVERRDRRARLISTILERLGFQVEKKLDLLEASLTHQTRETFEKTLFALGKLTVYTKQLDMVMYNEAIVDWSIEEFFKEHLPDFKN